MISPAGDGLLTTAEAAERLGVVPKTLRDFVSQGLVGVERRGRRFLFGPDELDRFARQQLVARGELEHLYPAGQNRLRNRTQAHGG